MMNKSEIIDWLKDNLSSERFHHVLGSEKTAVEMAKRFNADAEKAGLASLMHDCAKCMTTEELLNLIDENNIEVTEMERNSYKTLHAPVGAYIAKIKFGVQDQEILDAIRYHTIGRINMGIIEKIVFLADKIEENTRCSEFRAKIMKVLDETKNIDEGILICYDTTIRSLLNRKLIINPQTIDVYNDLLIKSNKLK